MAKGKFKPKPELDRLIPSPGERLPEKPSEDVRLGGYEDRPVNLFRAPWLRNLDEKGEK